MDQKSPLMTVDELAVLLRLNRDTAYKAVAERQVPGVRKIGRTIRIHRAAITAWLETEEPSKPVRRRLQ